MMTQRDEKNSTSQLLAYYLQPISIYLTDPTVNTIFVNSFNNITVRRRGVDTVANNTWANEQQLQAAIEQIANRLDQTVDPLRTPILNARLPDGTRINAVLPPVAVHGANMVIRLFPKQRFSLTDLIGLGMLSSEIAEYLLLAIQVEYSFLVSGISGSGKTTLLNAMLQQFPKDRRVGIVEDTTEIALQHANLIQMEAARRDSSHSDKTQSITMGTLIVNTLRQELQNLIVGEIRDPEAATALMLALTTGCRGVAGTIHASSARNTVRRLETMMASNDSRVPYEATRFDIHSNIDLIIYCEKTPLDGQRVVEIAELSESGLNILWRWDFEQRKHVRVFAQSSKIALDAARYGIAINQHEYGAAIA